MNQRNFIKNVLIGVLLFIVLFGGYLIWSGRLSFNTKDNIDSDWKEFVGETAYKNKFSVGYPTYWSLGSSRRGEATLNYVNCEIVLGAGGRGIEGSQEIKTEPIMINGVSGETKTYIWLDDPKKTEFIFTNLSKENQDYIFELNDSNKNSKCLDDYKAIINTFKIESE